MQQTQTVSLPAHYQASSENVKLYEPGECYAEFVRNLPKNLPEHLHSDSICSENTRYKGRHAHILDIVFDFCFCFPKLDTCNQNGFEMIMRNIKLTSSELPSIS